LGLNQLNLERGQATLPNLQFIPKFALPLITYLCNLRMVMLDFAAWS